MKLNNNKIFIYIISIFDKIYKNKIRKNINKVIFYNYNKKSIY